MFFTVKGKTIVTVLVLAVALALCLVMLSYASAPAAVPKNGVTIVIDAGHGGVDGGVSGSNTGVKESEINLAIAKSLRHFLTRNGYEVVMTRKDAEGLYEPGAKSKKLSDMNARRKIIEQAAPDLIVSIHQNHYPLASVHGAQVFYREGSDDTLAAALQGALNVQLKCDRKQKTGDYYLLTCSEYPSLLVECGFLSNPEEERLLADANYQQKVAYTIFSTIHARFTLTDNS